MNPAVWIVACDQEARSAVSLEFSRHEPEVSQPIAWCGSSKLADDGEPPRPIADLAAVILVVDREALRSDGFRNAVRRSIGAMADRDDFWVFPWLREISVAELQELAKNNDDVARVLVDNVHLDPEMESLGTMTQSLRTYLDNWSRIHAFTRFEAFSLLASQATGRVFEVVSGVVVIAALFASVWLWNARTRGDNPSQAVLDTIAVLTYTAAVILGLSILHWLRFLVHAMLTSQDLRMIGTRLFVSSIGGYVISMAGASIPLRYDTLVIGVGFGLAMVSIVRKGRRSHVHSLAFVDLPELVAKRKLLPQLYQEMEESLLRPGMALFEPFAKRVFISYSRNSRWSAKTAGKIADSLRALGAYAFLDRGSIRPGSSWPKQLHWALEHSNVFVVVLDARAVSSEWIAAEFATAFRNKTLSGTPEIFVVHPKDFDFSAAEDAAAVFFKEVLTEPKHYIPQRMRSRLAPYDPKTFEPMCRAIRNYPIAGEFGALINILVGLLAGPTVTLVGLASMLGLPLAIMHVLAAFDIMNPRAFVAEHTAYVGFAVVVLAVLAAFSVRMAVRGFAEIRRKEYSYAPGWVEVIEAVSFLVAVWYCVPWLSVEAVCMAAIGAWAGVEMGTLYATQMGIWEKQTGPADFVAPVTEAQRD